MSDITPRHLGCSSSSGRWCAERLGTGASVVCGQHVLAKDCLAGTSATHYLTGPSDFVNGRPVATKSVIHPGVMCKKGDILLTVKGSGVGTLALADRDYCISRQLMAIRGISWMQPLAAY